MKKKQPNCAYGRVNSKREKKFREQNKTLKNAFVSTSEEDIGRHHMHKIKNGFNKTRLIKEKELLEKTNKISKT